jgi:hypothetical protein
MFMARQGGIEPPTLGLEGQQTPLSFLFSSFLFLSFIFHKVLIIKGWRVDLRPFLFYSLLTFSA